MNARKIPFLLRKSIVKIEMCKTSLMPQKEHPPKKIPHSYPVLKCLLKMYAKLFFSLTTAVCVNSANEKYTFLISLSLPLGVSPCVCGRFGDDACATAALCAILARWYLSGRINRATRTRGQHQPIELDTFTCHSLFPQK